MSSLQDISDKLFCRILCNQVLTLIADPADSFNFLQHLFAVQFIQYFKIRFNNSHKTSFLYSLCCISKRKPRKVSQISQPSPAVSASLISSVPYLRLQLPRLHRKLPVLSYFQWLLLPFPARSGWFPEFRSHI